MKNFIAIALLSTIVAMPAVADTTPTKASTWKPVAAMPAGGKHNHNMAGMKEDCDSVHAKGDCDVAHKKGDCDSKHAKGDCDVAHKKGDCDSKHAKGDCDVAHKKGDCDSKHAKGDCDVAHKKGDCDSKHEMGNQSETGKGDHRGYAMMGGQNTDMMMAPDMHMLGALKLSKEQQAKITQLSDELKHKNWTTQGLINDETAKLRDLYQADKRDPAAIGAEYQKVFDLKRQMIETYLDVENRIEEALTPEQLTQLKQSRATMRHMYGRHMQ